MKDGEETRRERDWLEKKRAKRTYPHVLCFVKTKTISVNDHKAMGFPRHLLYIV